MEFDNNLKTDVYWNINVWRLCLNYNNYHVGGTPYWKVGGLLVRYKVLSSKQLEGIMNMKFNGKSNGNGQVPVKGKGMKILLLFDIFLWLFQLSLFWPQNYNTFVHTSWQNHRVWKTVWTSSDFRHINLPNYIANFKRYIFWINIGFFYSTDNNY